MNNDSLELIDIKSMDDAQLQAYFEQLGEKKIPGITGVSVAASETGNGF